MSRGIDYLKTQFRSSSGHEISMRDYFAAKAMEGIIYSSSDDDAHAIAKSAYIIADAMLEARKQ